MIFKQIALAILGTIFFSSSVKSQTTLEEYNYVTKGYKIQLESGLDMKQGYKFMPGYAATTTTGTDKRSVEIKILRRMNENRDTVSSVAGYMITYQLNNGPKEYLCLPHPKSDVKIKNAFLESLYPDPATNASSRLQAIIYGLSGYLKW